MQDYKSCKTNNEYIYEAMMRRLTRIIVVTALILEAFICIVVSAPKTKIEPDYMISPDMASYIETYHATVDEYGVE